MNCKPHACCELSNFVKLVALERKKAFYENGGLSYCTQEQLTNYQIIVSETTASIVELKSKLYACHSIEEYNENYNKAVDILS